MPVRTALRTATDIAHAVTVLHESGVLHRDLKPSNVLFDTVRGAERVLVADLGLAKAIAQASGFTVVAGTPGYMAPEQSLPGGGLDVRADVHAIGAMTYQMLTGRTPHAGRPAAMAPSKLRPGVPKQVDRVVMRALDADRERRWPSPATFAAALNASITAGPSRAWLALRRTVGAGVALAALALTAGATVPYGTPDGWVRVTDRTGALSVAVPRAWAGQLRDAGWDAAALGLPAGNEPGLQVGAALDDDDSPSLLAGASRWIVPGATATWPTHPGCTREAARRGSFAGLNGEIHRWTSCAGTTVAYSDVLLSSQRSRGVYLQLKQVNGVDRTDEVLRTIRLHHPT